MQQVVFDEPYQFIPPFYSDWGPRILRHYVRRYIRKAYGVHRVESRHVERLQASVAAGKSIMLAPNHCRLSDPMVLGVMALDVPVYLHAMASWHLFKESAFQTFIIRASARSACCGRETTASRSKRRSTFSSLAGGR